MKNVMKNKKVIAAAAAVVLIIIAIVIARFCAGNAIRNGIPDIVDSKINVLVEEAKNPESKSDARAMGLQKVTYEITKIKKEKGVYILSLQFNCICENKDASETTKSLLAYDVEDCFDTYDDFYIGKYHCRYYSDDWKNGYAYKPVVFAYVNDELIHQPEKWSASDDKDTVKCDVCGKYYKKGSENAKSIQKTNMCENCYSNYKWTQEVKKAIDNLPVN